MRERSTASAGSGTNSPASRYGDGSCTTQTRWISRPDTVIRWAHSSTASRLSGEPSKATRILRYMGISKAMRAVSRVRPQHSALSPRAAGPSGVPALIRPACAGRAAGPRRRARAPRVQRFPCTAGPDAFRQPVRGAEQGEQRRHLVGRDAPRGALQRALALAPDPGVAHRHAERRARRRRPVHAGQRMEVLAQLPDGKRQCFAGRLERGEDPQARARVAGEPGFGKLEHVVARDVGDRRCSTAAASSMPSGSSSPSFSISCRAASRLPS